MAPIVASIESARPAEDVFAYVTDPSTMPEWQQGVVSGRMDGSTIRVGSRCSTVRSIGGRERTVITEITECDPPHRWADRGIDGPIRAIVGVTVEPLADPSRSRVRIEVDFTGHGIGKVLVPLVVRRQAAREMPENMRRLKEQLEAGWLVRVESYEGDGRDDHRAIADRPRARARMTGPTQPRTQPMRLQNAVNRVVRGLLVTPGISRGIGARLVTLYVVGRRSGRRYAIPVAYTRQGEKLLIGTPFAWGKNLRSGQPIEIRLQGARRRADVEAFSDEPSVLDHYATLCRDNAQFAKFNRIGLDANGNPNAGDLHAAWAARARSFLLTPR